MPAAFALAHVALIASTGAETFGRTSIESQAMGLPGNPHRCRSCSRECYPADSSADFTGWVVPPADSAALAVYDELLESSLTLKLR